MRKLYEKYIKIPNGEKISDRVFKSRIILSAIAILSCLTIMASTAFAFFSTNLEKEFTMHAATWDVYIEGISRGRAASVYTCPQTEGEMHTFTLSPYGTATEGYCIIKIKDNKGIIKEYCTPTFREALKIRIQAVAGCEIAFEPHWGSPKAYETVNTFDGTIFHSFTPPPPPAETSAEEGGNGASTEGIENESDASKESVENTSAETSSVSSDNGSSETDNSANSESATETAGNSAQSSDDGDTSTTSTDTSPSNTSSSESDSASDGGESSSLSSQASSGDESSASSEVDS